MSLEKETLNWSNPSPVNGETDGWVYVGEKEATDDDLDLLNDYLKEAGLVMTWDDCDELSLVGTHDREWSSHFYENTEGGTPPGGEGSTVYQNQKLGAGVEMTKEKVWHYTAAGDFVNAKPANFAYHKKDMGGGYYDLHEGPEPGSQAEKKLGDGFYKWSRRKALWVIRD